MLNDKDLQAIKEGDMVLLEIREGDLQWHAVISTDDGIWAITKDGRDEVEVTLHNLDMHAPSRSMAKRLAIQRKDETS
jgi:hypothetical protein